MVAPVTDLNGANAGDDATAAFTEQTPVEIAPTATITDADSADLASLTATLTNRPDGDGVESLLLNAAAQAAAAGLTVTYTQATGVLSITGSASVATYQTILQGIQYNNTSDTPNTADRIVNVVVSDGTDSSALNTVTIGVTAVDDAPTIANLATTRTFTENGGPLLLDDGIAATVADVDSPDFNGGNLTVAFSAGGVNTEDVLSIVSGGNISFNGGTGEVSFNGNIIGTATGGTNGAALVVTFNNSGNATPAATSALIHQIAYQNTNTADPNTGNRTVSFTVNDGDGATSAATDVTVQITPVNDEPTLTATGNNPNFTEPAGLGTQAAAVSAFSGTSVSTVEAGQGIIGLDFTVRGLRDGAAERIVVDGTTITLGANSSGVTATNGMSYTVTLAGSAGIGQTATIELTKATPVSTAAIQTLVNNITYQDTNADNPTAGDRTFTLTHIQDSGGTANGGDDTATLAVASTVHVIATDDGPLNTLPAGPLTAQEDTNFTITGVSVSDADAAPQNIQVTLSVQHGILDVRTDVGGGVDAAHVSGDTTGSVTLTGTPTQINATLGASNGLIYHGNLNFSGSGASGDTLTMVSNDLGHTGNGGPLSDTDSVGINVTHVVANTLSAFQSSVLTTDVDGDGKIDPGDTITTTVQVTNNSATTAALNVTLSETLSGLTQVGNPNVTPHANDDSYTAVGNTLLEVGNATTQTGPQATVAGHVTDNDVEFFGDTFEITKVGNTTVSGGSPVTITTANGGHVTMITSGADRGSFTYISNAGFTGNDSFTYTISDDGLDGIAGTADDLSNTATVNITVSGQVWYVDSNAAAGGDGTSTNPFNAITAANLNGAGGAGDVDDAGDYIYIQGSPAGPLALETNEHLIGTGAALVVNGITLASAGTNSTLSASSGTTLTLASGNEVAGINVTNSNAAGTGISGTNFGTATFTNAKIDSSGQGLILSTGTVAGTGFTSVDSDAGTNNVSLTGVSGTVNLGTGALSGASGVAFNVSGGNASIDYNGSIAKTADGRVIDVQNHTGGTVSFDGTVSSTSASDGINLQGNTGATINFTNTLTLDTSASGTTAFNASGGGTVTATGTGSTISSGAGSGLIISNTNIGANDVTFRSISSGSGVGSSANGIILDTTGTAGGLHVTGTGAAGSGGTIQHKTGANGSTTQGTGIFLNNTSDVQLNNMQLNDFDNYGIKGTNVTGFTLNNSTINGVNGNNNAGGVEEGSIRFDNLNTSSTFPTAAITNSSIGGGFTDNLHVINTSGTLDRLTVTGNTFGLVSATGGNDNVHIESSAVTNVTVSNNTFAGTKGDFVETIANLNGVMDVVVRNNDFNNGQAITPGGGTGVSVRGDSAGTAATVTFDIENNTLNDGGANAFDTVGIFVAKGNGAGTFAGTIANNTVGPAKANANADGIFVRSAGSGSLTALIEDNTVNSYGNAGIHLQNNDGSATMNASLFGNTESNPNSQNFAGLFADNGATATDTSTMNLIAGSSLTAAEQNTFHGTVIDASLSNFNANTHFNLSKAGSASGTAAGVIQDDNVGTPTVDTTGGSGPITLVTANTFRVMASPSSVSEDGSTNITFTFLRYGDTASAQTINFSVGGSATFGTDYTQLGATTFNGAAGSVTFAAGSGVAKITIDPTADAAIESNETVTLTITSAGAATPSAATATILNDDLALQAAPDVAPSDQPAPPANDSLPPADDSAAPPAPGLVESHLTQAQLDAMVSAATAAWEATGLTAEQSAALHNVTFTVADLSAQYLGSANQGHVVIDSDGAGYGWYVDADPGDNVEFAQGSGTHLTAASGAVPAGHMDLLTAVMHEMGHQLGLSDSYAASDQDSLMYGFLNTGERRLPAEHQAGGATPGAIAHEEFLASPINWGTLRPGETFTVQWNATVNPQTNQLINNPTNQGTVTATNPNPDFPDVNTNVDVTTLDSLTLGDRVFIDLNNNNLFDPGEGIDGVTLTLFADTNHSGDFDAGDTQLATTTTAGGGLYSFIGLAPGDYIVRVDQGNFAPGGALHDGTNPAFSLTGSPDPDNNVDNDDNGAPFSGNGAVSQAITLNYNTETTADATGQLDINNTLDFGFNFVQPNAAPVITAAATAADFTEGGTAFVLDSALTVSDADGDNIQSASVKINGFVPGDVLAVTNPVAGITTSYNPTTGVLTLSGSAPASDYQTVLRSVTFISTSENPTNVNTSTNRSIAWTANDGNSDSAPAATTFNVIPENDGPTNTVPGGQTVNEDTPLAFTGLNTISVADVDAGSVTVTLDVAHGTLGLTALGGAALGGAGGHRTVDGTLAAVNQTLATLTYQGNLNFNGSDQLSVVVDDHGQTGPGVPPAVLNPGLTDSDSFAINVTAVNDAPTVVGATETLAAIDEDATNPPGNTVANLFQPHFSDAADQVAGGSAANNFAGVAVTANAATAAEGTWQWSTDGTTWTNVDPAVNDTHALLLDPNAFVRFLPATNFNGTTPALTVRVVDDSQGAIVSGDPADVSGFGGTSPYSAGTVALSETINPVNDAPNVVNGNTASLAAIDEDTTNPAGTLISAAFGTHFSDADDNVTGGSTPNAFAGIAITGNAATAQGTWQWSTDGVNWNDIDTAVSDSNALVLAATTQIRFVPAPDFFGAAPDLTVHLIDDSAGAVSNGAVVDISAPGATGDPTQYSTDTVALTETINPVNDAPVIDAGVVPDLATENEDAGAPVGAVGTLVANIADLAGGGGIDNISDADDVPLGAAVTGIALTATDTTHGTWFYSLDNGANWNPVGVVDDAHALLLPSDTQARLYFQPTADFNTDASGPIDPAISFRAWDQTSGSPGTKVDTTTNGTTTAFSTDTAHADLAITAVADAVTDTATVNEDSATTIDVLGNDNFEDPARALTSFSAAAHGSITRDDNGTIGNLTDDKLIYTPNANYNGPDSFTYTVLSGGVTETGTVNVTVAPVNDSPVLANVGPSVATNEQTAVVLDTNAHVSDIDLDAFNGGAGDYAGASLTIARQGGANAEDTFGFSTAGATFTVSGSTLRSGGLAFANFSIVAGLLTIDFTSSGIIANTALVNDVLDHITYTNLSDTPPPSVNLGYTFNDGSPGHGQGAGATGIATGSTQVNITAVDDAPVNHLPTNLQAFPDAFITGLSVSDPDAGNGMLTTTLAVDHGKLVVDAVGGGAAVTGSNTGSVMLTGTLAQINTTLAAFHNVAYHGPESGVTTFTMQTNDNGNTGAGGPLTDTDSAPIQVGHAPPLHAQGSGNFDLDPSAGYILRRDDGAFLLQDVDNNQATAHGLGAVGFDWHLVGTGDLNGDHQSDMLLRHDGDNMLSFYAINNNQVAGQSFLGAVGSEWHILTLGDLNGDGTDDILIQRDGDGMLNSYSLQNGQITAATSLGPIGGEWKFLDGGDFNNDGTTDLVWQRGADGMLVIQQIHGTQVVGGSLIGQLGGEWHFVSAGDFNGDHTKDLLFQRDDGALQLYNLNNYQIAGSTTLETLPFDADIGGVRDYTGDGTDDILLQFSDGHFDVQEIHNNAITQVHHIGQVGAEWHLV